MPPKPKINVQSFPRPPLLERTPRHLQIKYKDHTIADTSNAFWVLETHHAPSMPSCFLPKIYNPKIIFTNQSKAYYLPTSSLSVPLKKTPKRTFCEWKGWATYYSINVNGEEVNDRIWGYESPTERYRELEGCVSFYVGPWGMFFFSKIQYKMKI